MVISIVLCPRNLLTLKIDHTRPQNPPTSDDAHVWRRSCQRTGRAMPAVRRYSAKRFTFSRPFR
jgi:hypothetical protein